LDLRRALSVLRGWWPLLVASVVLACGAALAVTSVSTRIYRAEATIEVGDADPEALPEYAQILAAQRLADSYERIATTRPVLERVVERLQLDTDVDDLSDRVSADAPTESTFITISVESEDPEDAARVANAVSEEVVTHAPALLRIVEPAVASGAPVSPRPLQNAAIAAFVGLLVAGTIAFAAEYLNDRFQNADTVREVLGLPTLGEVVRMRWDRRRSESYGLATLVFPRSPAAEAYRTLRTNIEFASVDAPLRSLLVTSAVPGEGKSLTAANLAIAFAQTGKRVLLVDGDLRRPSVAPLLRAENAVGLTTLFRPDPLSLSQVLQDTDQTNLTVLTTGPTPPNPSELLGSERMRLIVRQLETSFDLVVFDSPPLRAVTDASILSTLVDGTVIVVDAVLSRQHTVRHSVEALRKANGKLLGVVLNRLPTNTFTAYHNYHSMDQEDLPKEAAKAPRPATGGVALGDERALRPRSQGEGWRS
jgi:capsular exopolysaccharide synthesis family protein